MDKIRAALPEEIKQAKFVNLEREKFLQDAQRRADKMLEEAENQARKMVSEDQVMKQVQIEAEDLLQQARKTSSEIKQGARVYANDLLHQLEINLEKALYTIKKGREELQGHQEQNRYQKTGAKRNEYIRPGVCRECRYKRGKNRRGQSLDQ